MSFLSELLKKLKKKSPPAETEKAAPNRSVPAAGDALSDLRFKARTGDPRLTEKHRSGNF